PPEMKRLLVVLAVALLASGCGKSAPSGPKEPPTSGAPALQVIATALTEGDPSDVTALLLTEKALFVGTKKGVKALKMEVGKDGKGTFSDADIPLVEPAIKNYEVHAIR